MESVNPLLIWGIFLINQEKELELQPPADICSELFLIINDRRTTPEEGSYTNHLLNGGDNRILKKIGEESAEFVMACKDEDKKSIANEAADWLSSPELLQGQKEDLQSLRGQPGAVDTMAEEILKLL